MRVNTRFGEHRAEYGEYIVPRVDWIEQNPIRGNAIKAALVAALITIGCAAAVYDRLMEFKDESLRKIG
jgi:hypothetical protein